LDEQRQPAGDDTVLTHRDGKESVVVPARLSAPSPWPSRAPSEELAFLEQVLWGEQHTSEADAA
jgi:hypothetical protein